MTAPEERERELLEFDCGVRAYEPAPGGYWRIRWEELGRRRESTASSRAAAITKADEVVERLSQGTDTALARAKGADLVSHYLDPERDMPRGRPWSSRHREAQESYCRRFVVPILEPVDCRRLTRADFQRVLDKAETKSSAEHLRRCLNALANSGLEAGYLLARQDVMRGVRWRGADPASALHSGVINGDEWEVSVADDEIPTHEAVYGIARAAAARSGVWWRELELLLVAYSGLRWGEHAALTASRVQTGRRRIEVGRQVVEADHGLSLALPKGRKRRTTIYPATTPEGVDLAGMVARRIAEVDRDGLLFPSPQGKFARRSNYRRNVFAPAADLAGWPTHPAGGALWTFHSLRHVFATWLLAQPGVTIEDVSRLMGHSSTRITQEVYVHFLTSRLDELFEVTAG